MHVLHVLQISSGVKALGRITKTIVLDNCALLVACFDNITWCTHLDLSCLVPITQTWKEF